MEIRTKLPKPAIKVLWSDAKIKGLRGGRGSGKSYAVAIYCVMMTMASCIRVLCIREYHTSIRESQFKTLCEVIALLGLQEQFIATENTLKCVNGSEFVFRGVGVNPESIRSLEGITITWFEEGQMMSERTKQVLLPTIFRKPDSQLIVTYNPENASDPVSQMLQENPMPRTACELVNWNDNEFITDDLKMLMAHDYATDVMTAKHVWEGDYTHRSREQIYADKCVIQDFELPTVGPIGPFYGMDFGTVDPNVFIEAWIWNGCIYVTQELVGLCDLREMPAWMTQVTGWWRQSPKGGKVPLPNVRIYADCARPEVIVDLQGRQVPVIACTKYPGCVEERIHKIRKFDKIVIHSSLRPPKYQDKWGLCNEQFLYKYKVDAKTQEILPGIIDKYNHSWDALAYALQPVLVTMDQNFIVSHDCMQGVNISTKFEADMPKIPAEQAAFAVVW